jgi:hypothetical protein
MPWLTSLLKRPDSEPVTVLDDAPIEHAPAPSGPQLAVLIPDIAGISSFRLRLFPDAQSASEHIASLRSEVRRGVHGFWALHEAPVLNEEMHVETLVLIRAQENSDLVYVVSFLDLESANSFTRFEVRRGLQITNVMIYWAAFAQIREELDGVTIHPAMAPITRPSWMEDSFEIPTRPVNIVDTPVSQASVAPSVADPALSPAAAPDLAPEPTVPVPSTPIDVEHAAIDRYLRQREDEDRREQDEFVDKFVKLDRSLLETTPADDIATDDSASLDAEETLWPDPVADTLPEATDLDEELDEPLWPEASATTLAPEAVDEAEVVEPEEILWPEPIADTLAEATRLDDETEEPLWPEATAATVAHAPELEPDTDEAPDEALWAEAAAATLDPAAVDSEIDQETELFSEIEEEQAALEPTPEPEIFSDIPEEQAALEQAYVFSHNAVNLDPEIDEEDFVSEPALLTPEARVLLEEGIEAGLISAEVSDMPEAIVASAGDEEFADTLVIGSAQVIEPEAVLDAAIVTSPGDEEVEAPPTPQVAATPEVQASKQDGAKDPPEVEPYNGFDIAFEVERLLRNRNWGRKDEPFNGFKSPPGRF